MSGLCSPRCGLLSGSAVSSAHPSWQTPGLQKPQKFLGAVKQSSIAGWDPDISAWHQIYIRTSMERRVFRLYHLRQTCTSLNNLPSLQKVIQSWITWQYNNKYDLSWVAEHKIPFLWLLIINRFKLLHYLNLFDLYWYLVFICKDHIISRVCSIWRQ